MDSISSHRGRGGGGGSGASKIGHPRLAIEILANHKVRLQKDNSEHDVHSRDINVDPTTFGDGPLNLILLSSPWGCVEHYHTSLLLAGK